MALYFNQLLFIFAEAGRFRAFICGVILAGIKNSPLLCGSKCFYEQSKPGRAIPGSLAGHQANDGAEFAVHLAERVERGECGGMRVGGGMGGAWVDKRVCEGRGGGCLSGGGAGPVRARDVWPGCRGARCGGGNGDRLYVAEGEKKRAAHYGSCFEATGDQHGDPVDSRGFFCTRVVEQPGLDLCRAGLFDLLRSGAGERQQVYADGYPVPGAAGNRARMHLHVFSA